MEHLAIAKSALATAEMHGQVLATTFPDTFLAGVGLPYICAFGRRPGIWKVAHCPDRAKCCPLLRPKPLPCPGEARAGCPCSHWPDPCWSLWSSLTQTGHCHWYAYAYKLVCFFSLQKSHALVVCSYCLEPMGGDRAGDGPCCLLLFCMVGGMLFNLTLCSGFNEKASKGHRIKKTGPSVAKKEKSRVKKITPGALYRCHPRLIIII